MSYAGSGRKVGKRKAREMLRGSHAEVAEPSEPFERLDIHTGRDGVTTLKKKRVADSSNLPVVLKPRKKKRQRDKTEEKQTETAKLLAEFMEQLPYLTSQVLTVDEADSTLGSPCSCSRPDSPIELREVQCHNCFHLIFCCSLDVPSLKLAATALYLSVFIKSKCAPLLLSVYASLAQILRCVSIAPISIFSGALAALSSRASSSVWNTCGKRAQARARARGYFAVRGIVSSAICTILQAFESHGRGQVQHCVLRSLSLCNAAAQAFVPLHCCLRRFDELPLHAASDTGTPSGAVFAVQPMLACGMHSDGRFAL
ncbi:hypothetical protein B0H13DRAFT_2332636 [Mycena leptocephala]|nr:hypothetical protein B0H13DRAFT_2332636 [Mycena leptocephala]